MKKCYYAVKWGETIRISEKVSNRYDACLDCYGTAASNMYIKNLGSIRSVLQVDKRRILLLKSPDGWKRLTKKEARNRLEQSQFEE